MAIDHPDRRAEAAEAYLQAMRQGTPSAAKRAGRFLAQNVVLVMGSQEFHGLDAVLPRVTGEWPATSVYQRGAWSAPLGDGDRYRISGDFPGLGAAPGKTTLTFSYDAEDKISHIQHETAPGTPPALSATFPAVVRGLVNSALFNGTPMVVAYVDESGAPVQSLRGSVQVFGPTQLSAWLRNAGGGMAASLQHNPRMSLLYRDSKARTTLIFQGRGHIATDETTRQRVFEISPEVEQFHDPERNGAALIIDVERVQGGTPAGPLRMVSAG